MLTGVENGELARERGERRKEGREELKIKTKGKVEKGGKKGKEETKKRGKSSYIHHTAYRACTWRVGEEGRHGGREKVKNRKMKEKSRREETGDSK